MRPYFRKVPMSLKKVFSFYYIMSKSQQMLCHFLPKSLALVLDMPLSCNRRWVEVLQVWDTATPFSHHYFQVHSDREWWRPTGIQLRIKYVSSKSAGSFSAMHGNYSMHGEPIDRWEISPLWQTLQLSLAPWYWSRLSVEWEVQSTDDCATQWL